jgi:trigger factor
MTTTVADYKIKERSATEITLRITIGETAVQKALEAVYQQYRTQVRIPGFRKGHVPRNLLDSRFGQDRFWEETQEALQKEHLANALSELELRPVTRPRAETISFGEGEPFVFEVHFSVLPEIELPDYRGLELSVAPLETVTDNDDVTAALEEIRHRLATLVPKKGNYVSEGDIVEVDDGEKKGNVPAQAEHPLGRALIGHQIGDSVTVRLEGVEGHPSHFVLSVLGLKEIRLPEIDDELAKDAGFESLDALKMDLTRQLTDTRHVQRERSIKDALLDRLAEKVEIPIPKTLLNELVAYEIERMKESLQHLRPPLPFDEYLNQQGKTEEDMRADVRAAISQNLRRDLLVQKVAKAENISVSDSEAEEIATKEAQEKGEDALRFIARLKAEDRFQDYRNEIIRGRTLDLLYETAQITEEAK